MYRSLNAMTVGGARLYVHFHDIVATARQRNAQAGIGGFLMFDRSRFHQILEGPEERVDVLFAKICNDNRHATSSASPESPWTRGVSGNGRWARSWLAAATIRSCAAMGCSR